MLIPALSFLLGLGALFLGAELLVRGAATLARSAGISPLVIGLTIVAFGTSAPELVVTTLAAGRGESGMAVGNVIGSNLFNLLVILGVAALIHPLRVQATLLVREAPIMLVAALALPLAALNGGIGRADAAVLLGGFALFLGFMLWTARAGTLVLGTGGGDAIAPAAPPVRTGRGAALLVVVGLAGLAGGAHLLVGAALEFARLLGLGGVVVGLTLVAAGTSLPELATCAVAALRRESDIALGNVIGSNIFNVLCVLGVAGLLQPLEVPAALLRLELPVMVAASLLVVPLAWTRLQLSRAEGALLLCCYAGFVALVLLRVA
jgi:cation:H+ antiporter